MTDAWIVESSSWCVSPCVCSFVRVDDDVAAQALDVWSRRLGTFYKFHLLPFLESVTKGFLVRNLGLVS
jgi:hypothetical protein